MAGLIFTEAVAISPDGTLNVSFDQNGSNVVFTRLNSLSFNSGRK